MANTIDSNITSLHYAEETSAGTVAAEAKWYQLEPNSYGTFSGAIEVVASNPIKDNRSNQRGSTTQVTATGDFETDVKFSNLTRLLRGFFFADYVERGSTSRLKAASSDETVTAVTTTGYTTTNTTPANGWYVPTGGSLLIYASGFTNSANNGFKKATAVTATKVSVASLTAEASAPSGARIDIVGIEGGAGVIDMDETDGVVTLTGFPIGTGTTNHLGLKAGEWIFIGGDATGSRLTAAQTGWARVKSVSAVTSGSATVTLDVLDFTAADVSSTSEKVQIFVAPRYLRNADVGTDIKNYTYQLERTLGSDGSSNQAQYLTGAVANELSLSIATADKVTASLAFVCRNSETKKGAEIKSVKTTNRRVKPKVEDIYNTSSNITATKLYLTDDNTSLFAYLSDLTLSITNEATQVYAVGSDSAIGTTTGNFGVTASTTAYFTDTDAIQSVRDNAKAGMYLGMANSNKGIMIDLPLLQVTAADLSVALGESITVGVETTASESEEGHTLQWGQYDYLPTVAMS